MKKLAAALLLALAGCSAAQARADLHSAAATALGVIHAAQANPELAGEAKALLVQAAEKADPAAKARIDQAAAYLTLGNADKAAAILAPIVAATASVGSQ